MERVLVGVDRSDASTRALEFAIQRASINQWKLFVVYVINWNRYAFTTPEDNEKRPVERRREIELAQSEVVDPMVKIAEQANLEVEAIIRHGKPSQVIADLAKELSADLVVVGRTGDSGLREAIFGSTASRLVQHAAVPVTVVP